MTVLAMHWDELAGALRRATAPVALHRHMAGACLRLLAVDLAVRAAALLWLMGDEGDIPDAWATAEGMRAWLRALAASTGLTRDALAMSTRVPPTTLDSWLDDDVRPTFENLDDLARALSSQGGAEHTAIHRRLRLTFAARDVARRIAGAIGAGPTEATLHRLARYANEMARFPRESAKPPEENVVKMRMALLMGAQRAEAVQAEWICAMVRHVWRYEVDPVWRTTLRAVTGSWLEHLQEIAAKLGPMDERGIAAILGRPATAAELEDIAYKMQARKEEEARDPRLALVMDAEAEEAGARGALELKLRAQEASNRGDLLGAIALLEAAAAKDATNAEIHFRLGCELWTVGDVARGLFELEIAAQLAPGWDRPRVEIAIVLLNQGRDDEARARLVDANGVCPNATWVLLHLGYAHERLGERAEAIRAYEELLEIEPDHAEALDRVAHLHLLDGDKRRGVSRAKRAAHLGIGTVQRAQAAGHYAGGIAERPPHDPRIERDVRFPDSAWRRRLH